MDVRNTFEDTAGAKSRRRDLGLFGQYGNTSVTLGRFRSTFDWFPPDLKPEDVPQDGPRGSQQATRLPKNLPKRIKSHQKR